LKRQEGKRPARGNAALAVRKPRGGRNLERAGGNPKVAKRENPEGGKVKRVVLPSAGETAGDTRTLQIGNNASRSVQT
jgi:hypothetical protein